MNMLSAAGHIVDVAYRFHPVGQGLFASGRITHRYHYSYGTSPVFSWVYDCGTNSSLKKHLIPELDHLLAQQCSDQGNLELVTLSHFDSDHVNGLTALLDRFNVDTLLLPLIPLWKRLELAFADGVSIHASLMSFYLNPVSYLLEHFPEQIRTIVLVPALSPDAKPRRREHGEYFAGIEDGDFRLEAEEELGIDQEEELATVPPSFRSRVKCLVPGLALNLGRCWEFLPYNDMHLCPAPSPSFTAEVQHWRSLLLRSSSATSFTRASALAMLRDTYDRTMGSSAIARNRISLFLYAGPIGNTVVTEAIPSTFKRPGGIETKANVNLPFSLLNQCRLAVLYTGDGYLHDQRSVQALLTYLGSKRLAALACLQVPHHGARSNWASGHAKIFSPDIAVFCSDPKRKSPGHPHREVIDDFVDHAVVPVDKQRGAILEGQMAVN